MKPIELLKQELDKLNRARDHSAREPEEGRIDLALHEQHIRNLTPMIEDYKFAITMLKQYIDT
jgi:primosomal protein N''